MFKKRINPQTVWLILTVKMLTDMIVEQEFEIKEEEPWYDKQDLEHGTVFFQSLSPNPIEPHSSFYIINNKKNSCNIG